MEELYMQAEELIGEEIVEMIEEAKGISLSADFNDDKEREGLIEALNNVIHILKNYEDQIHDRATDIMASAADYAVDAYKDGGF